MRIQFTRDSVCMGDDVIDNSKEYELSDDADCLSIMAILKEKNFLPHVSGNNAVWVLINDKGDEIFSFFMLKDISVKITTKNSLKQICGDVNKLHFRYYTSPSERGRRLFHLYKGDINSKWRDRVREEYQYCDVTEKLEQEWSKYNEI